MFFRWSILLLLLGNILTPCANADGIDADWPMVKKALLSEGLVLQRDKKFSILIAGKTWRWVFEIPVSINEFDAWLKEHNVVGVSPVEYPKQHPVNGILSVIAGAPDQERKHTFPCVNYSDSACIFYSRDDGLVYLVLITLDLRNDRVASMRNALFAAYGVKSEGLDIAMAKKILLFSYSHLKFGMNEFETKKAFDAYWQ